MQLLFSGAIPGEADERGVTGVLGILDCESGEVLHRAEYETPPNLRAPGQKMQFTGYARDGERLYACCHNEIVWFDEWPPVAPAGRLTLPGFNDLHHCIAADGGLVVANTGLETVDHVGLDGRLIRRWDLLDGVADARTIDPEFEYRLLDDRALKPHVAHGNHVFEREGELWVTQLRTSRAVQLDDPTHRVEFEAGMPHDGRRVRDHFVFTTTNGHVVLVDPKSMKVEASHSLVEMTPGVEFLGWCRGVCDDPRGSDRYWVAFSYPRETRWREYAFWVKHRHKPLPTRIASYDLAAGTMHESFEIRLGRHLALFQLELLDRELWV